MPTPDSWIKWHRGLHHKGDGCAPDDPYHHDHAVLYPGYQSKAPVNVENRGSDHTSTQDMISEGGPV